LVLVFSEIDSIHFISIRQIDEERTRSQLIKINVIYYEQGKQSQ